MDFYKSRPDGFIYGTVKHGGAVMPTYGENIPEKEIWDVVNYIRFLQGK
jgi:mono/diheme cytochrome c family protein